MKRKKKIKGRYLKHPLGGPSISYPFAKTPWPSLHTLNMAFAPPKDSNNLKGLKQKWLYTAHHHHRRNSILAIYQLLLTRFDITLKVRLWGQQHQQQQHHQQQQQK